MVKTLQFHCRECRTEPWFGNEDLVGCVAKKNAKGFHYIPNMSPALVHEAASIHEQVHIWLSQGLCVEPGLLEPGLLVLRGLCSNRRKQ